MSVCYRQHYRAHYRKRFSIKLLAYYEEIGVEGTSFAPIIAFGDNGANPHGMPGDRKPKPGESVIVDIGGIKR